MRKALMAAQRMADDLVKQAEEEKAAMLSRTEEEVRTRKAELSKELEAEEFRLKQAQQATASYVEKVRALHIKEAECLSQLEGLYPPDTTPAPDPVEEKALEIDDNVQRLLNQAMQDATAEHLRSKAAQEEQDLSDTAEFTPGLPDEEEADDDGEDPPPRDSGIDFGRLQFGRDYEIT